MNTNDNKQNTTEETVTHLSEEKLNDVQGGNRLNNTLKRHQKKWREAQKEAQNSTIERHDSGASGSW